jgi:hypothetical protein
MLFIRKPVFGILTIFMLLILVSVASAALPTSVNVAATYPGPISYWSVGLSSIVPGDNTELPAGTYPSWCSDIGHYWTGGNPYTPFSSLETVPVYIQPANWSAINYIINNKGGYNKNVIQAVIWHYDGAGPGYPDHWSIQPYSHSEYDALLKDVEKNAGSHYTPGSGQKYAVILWRVANNQVIFVEADVDKIDPPVFNPPIAAPEFPSVVLPLGMMIGVAGLVYCAKTREN